MNGMHDMGGMHGFGPIEYEENEPVFHQAWEGRVFAMQLGVPVGGSLRPAIEQMEPAYAYRSRVVREPRAVLREFGLELPESTEIRVWSCISYP